VCVCVCAVGRVRVWEKVAKKVTGSPYDLFCDMRTLYTMQILCGVYCNTGV